jgi:predicted DNA-binding transcriptional regulator AlpA
MTEHRAECRRELRAPGPCAGCGAASEILVDADRAAALLCIGQRTLWSLTKRQAIPSKRIGRLVRYSPEELASWASAGCPTEPGSANHILEDLKRKENR